MAVEISIPYLWWGQSHLQQHSSDIAENELASGLNTDVAPSPTLLTTHINPSRLLSIMGFNIGNSASAQFQPSLTTQLQLSYTNCHLWRQSTVSAAWPCPCMKLNGIYLHAPCKLIIQPTGECRSWCLLERSVVADISIPSPNTGGRYCHTGTHHNMLLWFLLCPAEGQE